VRLSCELIAKFHERISNIESQLQKSHFKANGLIQISLGRSPRNRIWGGFQRCKRDSKRGCVGFESRLQRWNPGCHSISWGFAPG